MHDLGHLQKLWHFLFIFLLNSNNCLLLSLTTKLFKANNRL